MRVAKTSDLEWMGPVAFYRRRVGAHGSFGYPLFVFMDLDDIQGYRNFLAWRMPSPLKQTRAKMTEPKTLTVPEASEGTRPTPPLCAAKCPQQGLEGF